MTSRTVLALRSYLFAPGNHARRVEKSFESGADAVILDLEDAVATTEKAAARASVAAAFSQARSAVRGYVRINGFESPFWKEDVQAVVGGRIAGLVLPKAESAEQVRAVDAWISICERAAGLASGALELMLLIETAKGVNGVDTIAAASPRVSRLAFGGGDYTNDLSLEWTADEAALSYARARLTHASRAADLEPPVDTVVLQVKDQERFRQSARNGRLMGLHGKLCIHPDQIAPCHEVFTPGEQEIERAREIVAAFEAAEAQGSASIQVRGIFVDYPVVYRAQRVLALAIAAASRDRE